MFKSGDILFWENTTFNNEDFFTLLIINSIKDKNNKIFCKFMNFSVDYYHIHKKYVNIKYKIYTDIFKEL
jgi:hypothetical protein